MIKVCEIPDMNFQTGSQLQESINFKVYCALFKFRNPAIPYPGYSINLSKAKFSLPSNFPKILPNFSSDFCVNFSIHEQAQSG